jgi:hypothetical protein
LVHCEERPCPRIRTVSASDGPVQVPEERMLLCVRAVPSLAQRYREAEAEVEKWQMKVAGHPGWPWAEGEFGRAQKEADRLRSQLAAESAS